MSKAKTLNERQSLVLCEFARHGGLLVPGDDEVKSRCRELTDLKLMRSQPFIDGNKPVGQAKVGVAYQITAAGRNAVAVHDDLVPLSSAMGKVNRVRRAARKGGRR
jgi:hypothetical protein